MYETKQCKEKVSRRIDGGGMARQRVKVEDRFNRRLTKVNIQLRRIYQRRNPEKALIQRRIKNKPRLIIYYNGNNLNIVDREKIENAATILANTIDSDRSFTIYNIIISIEKENGLSCNRYRSNLHGENPALTEITNIDPKNKYSSIVICLQLPFVVVATEGQILGMLLHEVGVHSIPTYFRPVNDSDKCLFIPVPTARKLNKQNTSSRGYEFKEWPADHSYMDGNRQHDHVMISNIYTTRTGRAREYLRTYKKMGREIIKKNQPASQEIIKDMTDMFLVDIARIVATDDMRMPISKHLSAFYDLYQEGYRTILQPLRDKEPWIPEEPPHTSMVELGVSLGTLLTKAKFEKKSETLFP